MYCPRVYVRNTHTPQVPRFPISLRASSILIFLHFIIMLGVFGCSGGTKTVKTNRSTPTPSIVNGLLPTAHSTATPETIASIATSVTTQTSHKLSTPKNLGVTAADAMVTVEWDLVPGAKTYEVYYGQSTSVVSASKFECANPALNTCVISGLTNGQKYFAWVKAFADDKSPSDFSAFQREVSAIPYAPKEKPVAPTSFKSIPATDRVTLVWKAVDGASIYEVKISTDNDSSSAVVIPNCTSVNNYCEIKNLDPDSKHYSWVTAVNTKGESLASNAIIIERKTPITTPKNIVTVAANEILTVSWDSVPQATSYQVFYSTEDNLDTAKKALCKNPQITSCVLTGLEDGVRYFTWVKAVDKDGDISTVSTTTPQSSSVPFVPTVKPEAPAALAYLPSDKTVTLQWAAVSGSTGYEVYYGVTNDFSSAQQLDSCAGANNFCSIEGLTNNKPYYIWVKATNALGTSEVSEPLIATPKFEVAPPSGLELVIADSRITATWDKVDGAVGYEVYYSSTNDPATATKYSCADTSVNSCALSPLNDGSKYYVWVKTVFPDQVTSSINTQNTYAVPRAPTTVPAIPGDLVATVGSGQIALQWDAIEGASSYKVLYATTNDIKSAQVVDDCAASNNFCTISGLSNLNRYYFWVQASNALGDSTVSASLTTIPKLVPSVATLSIPGASPGIVAIPSFQSTGNFGVGDTLSLFAGSKCLGNMLTSTTLTENASSVILSTRNAVAPNVSQFYSIKTTDILGKTVCSNEVMYEYDTIISTPVLSLQSPSSSPGNKEKPSFLASGVFEVADTLTLRNAPNCGGDSIATTILETAVTQLVLTPADNVSANNEVSYSVFIMDMAGNIRCSNNVAYTYDNFVQKPTLALLNPASSPANLDKPTFRATGTNFAKGDTLSLYATANCVGGAVSDTSVIGATPPNYVDLTAKSAVMSNTVLTFSVQNVDILGNTACTTSDPTYIYDNNVNLSALALSAGALSPAFSAGNAIYSATVPNTTTSITVTATIPGLNASGHVQVNDDNWTALTSDSSSRSLALIVGNNTVKINIISADASASKTYTIIVNRAPSSIAILSGLSLSTGTLTPGFAAGTTSYSATVSNLTATVKITPTLLDTSGQISLQINTDPDTVISSGTASADLNLFPGANTINVKVVAEDGLTNNIYTISIIRTLSDIKTLASLTFSVGELSPGFASDTKTYSMIGIPNGTSSITIIPTLTDIQGTIQVKINSDATYSFVESGATSNPLNLNGGTNTITILTTAQNGVDTNTYAITFQTVPPNPTNLSSTPISDTAINLTWNSAGGSSTGYRVHYKIGATAPANCSTDSSLPADQITGTAASVSSLAANTQYSFRVCAINNNLVPDSSTGITVSDYTLATPPGDLSASSGSFKITLSWSPVNNVNSYAVYYATSSGITKNNSTRVVFAGSPQDLVLTGRYYFKIASISNGMEGLLSSQEVHAIGYPTPPTAPTDVQLRWAFYDGAEIMFSPVAGATKYRAYFGSAAGVSESSPKVENISTSGQLLTELSSNTQLSFTNKVYMKLSAIDVYDQESSLSSEVSLALPKFISAPANLETTAMGNDFVSAVQVSGNTIYAGTIGGGVAISKDNGATWRNYTTVNGLGNNSVRGIYVSESGKIYAATYGGLSVSANGGATWTNSTTDQGLIDNALLSMKVSGNTIYAGGFGGLSVSTDDGATWTKHYTTELAGNLVASVFLGNNKIYVGTNGGLSISSDDGTSWQNYTFAQLGAGNNLISDIYATGSNIYLATYGTGVSISTDNGTSWTNYNNSVNGLINDHAIKIYEENGSIYVGTAHGLSKSTNNGLSWTTLLAGQYVEYLKISGNLIYAGAFDGLFKSTDGGQTWNQYASRNGCLGSTATARSQVLGNKIYMATTRGVAISSDNGKTCTGYHVANGLASDDTRSIFVTENGNIYVATGNGVSISTNNGTSWSNYTTSNGLGSNNIRDIYVTTVNSTTTIYVATDNGVSLSTNNGVSWNNFTTAQSLGSNNVQGVYVSTVDSTTTIYAATDNGVSLSTNAGVSWNNFTTANQLAHNYVYYVYVADGKIYAATAWGVSISSNSGTSWTSSTTANGLGSNTVSHVYAVGSHVYAATSKGLSVSTDGGTSWTNYTVTDGLGDNWVLSVTLAGTKIYASTANGLSISLY